MAIDVKRGIRRLLIVLSVAYWVAAVVASCIAYRNAVGSFDPSTARIAEQSEQKRQDPPPAPNGMTIDPPSEAKAIPPPPPGYTIEKPDQKWPETVVNPRDDQWRVVSQTHFVDAKPSGNSARPTVDEILGARPIANPIADGGAGVVVPSLGDRLKAAGLSFAAWAGVYALIAAIGYSAVWVYRGFRAEGP